MFMNYSLLKCFHNLHQTVTVNDHSESDNAECLMGSIQSFAAVVIKGSFINEVLGLQFMQQHMNHK
jgi:hypothetical protein